MKKAILIFAALMLVASGVAAVSAYEAHLINVRAHVENAMSVDTRPIKFGTVFPEEWIVKTFSVGTSNSFCKEDQLRVTKIDYAIYVEWKPIPEDVTADPVMTGSDGNSYYAWLGRCLYVGIDPIDPHPQAIGGNLVLVGEPPATVPGAKWVMNSPKPINKLEPYNLNDNIVVALDVPVFETYYNVLTDPTPKPSGLDAPTWIIKKYITLMPGGEKAINPLWKPNGLDLGLDIKIQVTGIHN